MEASSGKLLKNRAEKSQRRFFRVTVRSSHVSWCAPRRMPFSSPHHIAQRCAPRACDIGATFSTLSFSLPPSTPRAPSPSRALDSLQKEVSNISSLRSQMVRPFLIFSSFCDVNFCAVFFLFSLIYL